MMDASISVKLQQDDFSAKPFFSVDSSPLIFPASTDKDQNVYLTTFDPYVASCNKADQDTDREFVKIFTEISSKQGEHYDWTPSIFVSYGSAHDQEDKTDDVSNLSMNFLRSIATIFRDEASCNRNNFLGINKYVALSLLTNPSLSKFLRSSEEISLNIASGQYFSILSDYLIPLSFFPSEEYIDVFGGRVVDYFRGVERISCIISMKHVQILSYINNCLEDKTFEQVMSAKLDILSYLEEIVE